MSTPTPFADPSVPNLADFTTFVYNQGVTTAQLPSNSLYLQWSFTWANDNTFTVPQMPSIIYVLAVYNYGFHHLLQIAQDQTGETFFTSARAQYNLLNFTSGPVIASGDQGTNSQLVEPEYLKNMTISMGNLLKTPWGQEYLSYAQQYGPTIVGFS